MKIVKQIKKNDKIYSIRWKIFQIKNICTLYLNEYFLAETNSHPHNHPWNQISLIISGGYMEMNQKNKVTTRKVGNLFYKSAKQFSEIIGLINTPTKVLTLVGPKINLDWGYLVNGKFIDFKTYQKFK